MFSKSDEKLLTNQPARYKYKVLSRPSQHFVSSNPPAFHCSVHVHGYLQEKPLLVVVVAPTLLDVFRPDVLPLSALVYAVPGGIGDIVIGDLECESRGKDNT